MVFDRSKRSLENVLNNFVRGEVNDISNPALRFGANTLLDQVLGSPTFKNNQFEGIIAENIKELNSETNQLTQAAAITSSGSVVSEQKDWRARLRPKNGGATKFYAAAGTNDSLMKPIQESGGLVWQYVPTIALQGSVEYHTTNAQGQNYPIRTYHNSTPSEIPITADFTANDINEARYLLAVMTFLKIATKGYFGDAAGADIGIPPPVLLFEYLGDYGFNKIPVVISSYIIQLGDDVDYVPVKFNDTVTYVPTMTQIALTLSPSYTPHRLRKNFDLTGIANGSNYKSGYI